MTIPNDPTPEFDLPADTEPRTEDEFLKQESRHAREALSRLRGEIFESLGNTADVSAWTRRYPWQSLAAAAVAGLGAGVAVGAATSKKSPPSEQTPTSSEPSEAESNGHSDAAHTEAAAHPSGKLVSSLATLLGIVGTSVASAATQAIAQVVKESIHDALKPERSMESEKETGENERNQR